MTAAAGAGGWSARRLAVVAAAGAAEFLATLDFTVVNVAFPAMQRAFGGVSLTTLSWVLTGYAVVFAAVLLPAGGLADRLGRRRLFLAGVAAFTLGSLCCALAGSPLALVAARALQATGGGAMVPLAVTVALPEFPAERHGTVIGTLSALGPLASASGPSIGGTLVSGFGWRAVFWVQVPIGLLIVLLTLAAREERAAERRPLPDVAEVGLVALTAGLGVLGIVQGPDWGWSSPAVAGALGGGLVAGALAVRRALRQEHPLLDLYLLRRPAVAAGNAALLLIGFVQYTFLLGNVLFLSSLWGWTSARVGAALSPGPLVAVAASVLAGRLGRRLGWRAIAGGGSLVVAAGCAWLAATAGQRPAYVAVLLPGLLMVQGFASGAAVAMNAAVLAAAGERLGTASAMAFLSRTFASALGTAGLAVLLTGQRLGDFRLAWTAMTVCAVAAAVASLGLPARAAEPAPAPGH
jgi:EmrB/QacA subfamily drug resistance transporter